VFHGLAPLSRQVVYNMDSPLDQRWRDVVGFEIGDGVPEIMKGVIAREAFGREYIAYRG
jgi:alkylation response protein AidB-like acyl-CoA dehydrogenase